MLADRSRLSREIEQSDWPKICAKLSSKRLTKSDGTPLDPFYVRKTWTKVRALVARLDAQSDRAADPAMVAIEQINTLPVREPEPSEWVDPKIATAAANRAALAPDELISQAEIIAYIEAQDAHAVLIRAQIAIEEAEQEACLAAAEQARQVKEGASSAAGEIEQRDQSMDLLQLAAAPTSQPTFFGRIRSAFGARPSGSGEVPSEFQPARIRAGSATPEHAAVRGLESERKAEREVQNDVERVSRGARWSGRE